MAHLEAHCTASDSQRTAKALATLFGAYPSSQLSGQDASLRARAYLDALSDRPAWAVEEAVRRWIRGEVDVDARARDFPPSAPKLREIVTDAMTPLFVEKGRLSLMLKAEVITPLSSEERAERLRRLSEILAQPNTEAAE